MNEAELSFLKDFIFLEEKLREATKSQNRPTSFADMLHLVEKDNLWSSEEIEQFKAALKKRNLLVNRAPRP